jgi:hypothetical protein
MSPLVEIDLCGPQGNAFYLLGMVPGLCKTYQVEVEGLEAMHALGIIQARSTPEYIRQQMMSGDYENLLAVFEEYFGDWVVLYR